MEEREMTEVPTADVKELSLLFAMGYGTAAKDVPERVMAVILSFYQQGKVN